MTGIQPPPIRTHKGYAGGAAALLLALSASAPGAGAQELRLGFITTLSGGAAILGRHQERGWKLGLEREGWKKDGDKLGGVPTKVIIGDDQRKPDVGLRVARRMLTANKVHIVAGVIWSNVAMAIYPNVIRARRIFMSTNAGPSPIAGRRCSPYFVTTSWQNDQMSEATGKLVADDGVKSVFLLAPNYQAGKDALAGFQRYYKGGKIAGRILFKLGQRDFQADISRIRAAKPEALFVFAPGGMGISFSKQWAASGANKDIKLYTVFIVDYLTLGPIGKAAVGTFHSNWWDPHSKVPANQEMVRAYMAKYKSMPSLFAAQSYDAPRLIAAAMRKLGGKFKDGDQIALAHALRTVSYDSVRGPYKYNVNGVPLQNYYKREVVLGGDGKPAIVNRGVIFTNHPDNYWKRCPKSRRYPK